MIPRLACAHDLDAMSVVHRAAFTPGWDAEAIADVGSGPGVFGLLIEADGPAAMILCRTMADDAEVLTLAVDPRVQRAGLAASLLEACCLESRLRGACSIFLEVAVDNDPAIALYRKAGFAQVGLRRGYYGRGAQGRTDALVMRRQLSASGL